MKKRFVAEIYFNKLEHKNKKQLLYSNAIIKQQFLEICSTNYCCRKKNVYKKLYNDEITLLSRRLDESLFIGLSVGYSDGHRNDV